MNAATLRLRLAGPEDAKRLFDWRNDSATRSASLETGPLRWETHLAWLENSLARVDRLLFIGEATRTDEPVGQVRLDERRADQWEVSITIAPHLRGLGWSTKLLQAAVDHLGPKVRLIARVRAENLRSMALFETCGFLRIAETDGVVTFSHAGQEAAA